MKKDSPKDTAANSPGFLRRKDAAQYLSISERWLSILQARRQIPFYKRGKVVCFRISDLNSYMAPFRRSAVWE